MNLTILGYTLGTLPAWVPVWAVPAAMVHVALFLALILPAWVGLARARAGGPLALVLLLPILGLLMLTPMYMNRVLPYAHWGRSWGLFVLIPGLNIFFLWIFAFAPWKRRYIPLDQEEYSEASQLARTGRSEPRLEGRSREPGSDRVGSETQGPTAVPGFTRGESGTMMPGVGGPPHSREPGTMIAGAAGARAGSRTGPSGETPHPTMIAGREGPQPLDEPVMPTPPVPARSMQPPAPPRQPPMSQEATEQPEWRQAQPPRQAPPMSRDATEPPEDRRAPQGRRPAQPPTQEPPRRAAPRTQDVTGRPPDEPGEAATMRVSAPPRAGGRAWRLVGANDIAAAFDFTVSEPALIETEAGLLVGRSARANFVVEHDSVSRNHARFLLDGRALCLEDLDSMNGTWVDGKKLEPNTPVPLQPGSIVEIGKIKLRVTGG